MQPMRQADKHFYDSALVDESDASWQGMGREFGP
jgi:hypothetical protein